MASMGEITMPSLKRWLAMKVPVGVVMSSMQAAGSVIVAWHPIIGKYMCNVLLDHRTRAFCINCMPMLLLKCTLLVDLGFSARCPRLRRSGKHHLGKEGEHDK